MTDEKHIGEQLREALEEGGRLQSEVTRRGDMLMEASEYRSELIREIDEGRKLVRRLRDSFTYHFPLLDEANDYLMEKKPFVPTSAGYCDDGPGPSDEELHGRTAVQRDVMMFGGATFEKVVEDDGSWNWHHRGRKVPAHEQLDKVRDSIEEGLVKGGMPREWSEIAVGKRTPGPQFELKARVPPCPQCHAPLLSPKGDMVATCEGCGVEVEIVLKLGE